MYSKNKVKELIRGYFKYKDNIPPIDEQESNFILESKEKLNQYFDNEKLEKIKTNLNDSINGNLKILKKCESNYVYAEHYLYIVSASFSCSGYPLNSPQFLKKSKIEKSQLIKLLEKLKTNIEQKINATEILDEIDEFKKEVKKNINI